MIHDDLRRRASISVALPALPHMAQISKAVLSTTIEMWYRGSMHGAKRRRWEMYAASYRSLIVKKPWGLSSMIMLARMAVINVIPHTCNIPKGIQ